MPNRTPQVPRNRETGEIQTYNGFNCEMVDTPVIFATMKIVGYSRGRSAARPQVEDERGNTYEMFLRDWLDVQLRHGWPKDGVHGEWTFCKRGTNYGLFMADLPRIP